MSITREFLDHRFFPPTPTFGAAFYFVYLAYLLLHYLMMERRGEYDKEIMTFLHVVTSRESQTQ